MDRIIEWLANPVDYAMGLELFMTYSRNTVLKKYFSKHKDESKLRYELSKLADIPEVKVDNSTPTVCKTPHHIELKSDYDKLPNVLKPIWEKATFAYRNARKFHYAMKNAKSDAERVPLRKKILQFISLSRASWFFIDNWKNNGDLPKEKPDLKNLNSSATALTRLLGKMDATSDIAVLNKLRDDVRIHINVLTSSGRTLSQKTIARLERYNISI